MCKASYTYATFYWASFRYSYGCFGFRFDSFFFFPLSVLLHTKETDTAQYFNGAPAIPDRPRFHWSMLCCSAPRCRQTGAVTMKRRPRLLIKKNTAVSSADYSAPGKLHREDGTLAAAAAARCGAILLDVSNKAYS